MNCKFIQSLKNFSMGLRWFFCLLVFGALVPVHSDSEKARVLVFEATGRGVTLEELDQAENGLRLGLAQSAAFRVMTREEVQEKFATSDYPGTCLSASCYRRVAQKAEAQLTASLWVNNSADFTWLHMRLVDSSGKEVATQRVGASRVSGTQLIGLSRSATLQMLGFERQDNVPFWTEEKQPGIGKGSWWIPTATLAAIMLATMSETSFQSASEEARIVTQAYGDQPTLHARSRAMGGAGVAFAGDAIDHTLNPASLAGIQQHSIQMQGAGTQERSLHWAAPLGMSVWHRQALRWQSAPSARIRTGTSQYALDASPYTRWLTGVHLGTALRFWNGNDNRDSNAFNGGALDLGMQMGFGDQHRFAATLVNAWARTWNSHNSAETSQVTRHAPRLRVGLATSLAPTWSLALDVLRTLPDPGTESLHAGIEWSPSPFLDLRTGASQQTAGAKPDWHLGAEIHGSQAGLALAVAYAWESRHSYIQPQNGQHYLSLETMF